MGALFSAKTVGIITVGVLALVGVWYFFFSDRGVDDALLTTTSEQEVESTVEQGIVDTLLKLRAVTLSGTIFSDPAYQILQDFGTQIIPEPTGRPNPFAPRGVEDIVSSGTSSTPALGSEL